MQAASYSDWSRHVIRLAGNGALDTMSAIVDKGEFAKGGTVVLASLEGYWDALTASGIAGLEKAPVLMTGQDGLSAQTAAQLKKLAPSKIIVCGGTYWIPDSILAQAASAAGISASAVTRLAGDNAAITAEQIFTAGKGRWSDTAIIATAGTFQDALAAAPLSYANAMPIFLAQFDFETETGYLTDSTIKAMKDGGITKAYIAGGTYWIPDSVVKKLSDNGIMLQRRLAGDNAVLTSGEIAAEAMSMFGMTVDNMGVATYATHYDALAGAAFCGINNSVLVLVADPKSPVIESVVAANGDHIAHGYIFGGTGSVSEDIHTALEKATAK